MPVDLLLACFFWQCAFFDPTWLTNPNEYRRRYGAVWTSYDPKRRSVPSE